MRQLFTQSQHYVYNNRCKRDHSIANNDMQQK